MPLGSFRLNGIAKLFAATAPELIILTPTVGANFTLTSSDSDKVVSTTCNFINCSSIQPSHPDNGQRNYYLQWQQTNGVFAARYNREKTYQNPVQVFSSTNANNVLGFSTGKRRNSDPHKRVVTVPQYANSRSARTGAVISSGYINGVISGPFSDGQIYGNGLQLNTLQYIEYIKPNNTTLSVIRRTVQNNNNWYGSSSAEIFTSNDFNLSTDFFNTVQWGSNYTFLYTVSNNADDKDVVIAYNSAANPRLSVVKNVFGHDDITTNLEKKGRILSAAINSANLNIVGFFNTSTNDLDIKIFSVNPAVNPMITFNPAIFRINFNGEKNIRFNDAGRANFCFITSIDETTNTAYIRRVTATTLENLAISPRQAVSLTNNPEELVLTSWGEHMMGLYKSGSTLSMLSYAFV